jgi:phosphonopyruvate decarboxylase
MIPAFDAIRAITAERTNEVVVNSMTPSRYWREVTTNPELDLPVFGGMGKASSVALGLALACPDRKVVVLDSDGGLLMNLGSLVTIAGQEPQNLVHFVFDDGVYYTTGGQPVPGAGKHDFAGIAREAGITQSYGFDNLEDFVSELPEIMRKDGPVFVCLKVSHGDDVPPLIVGSTGEAMKRLAEKLLEG